LIFVLLVYTVNTVYTAITNNKGADSMEVKARRQGNSTIFTIPKSINVPTDTKYNVYQDADGNIVYEPIKKDSYDIWADSNLENINFDELRKQELSDLGYNPREVAPVGKEKTDA